MIYGVHVLEVTRQMIIVVGGKPELCCGAAWLSERVGSMHACMHVRVQFLSRMQCACVVLYVESVTSEKNYCT